MLAANPFPDAAAARPSKLLVHFARNPIDPAMVARVTVGHDGPERLQAYGRELFVDYPDGSGRSKLPQAMTRAGMQIETTARNWNTVAKLVDLTA